MSVAVPAMRSKWTDTLFANTVVTTAVHRGEFDIITTSGRCLHRGTDMDGQAFAFSGGTVTVQGSYMLRQFDNINETEACTVAINPGLVMSDGNLPRVGVDFWPEILSQPEGGFARVANDGQNIACGSRTPGVYAFTYRLRNYLQQVSEPQCFTFTVV